MKFSRRLIILCGLLPMLSACGYFSPVYGTKSSEPSSAGKSKAVDELASIKVGPIADRMGHDVRVSLENLLNPQAVDVPTKYRLDIKLTRTEDPFAIRPDRSAASVQMQILAEYVLKESDTDEIVDKGTIKTKGSYNRLESEFGTYTAQEDETLHIGQDIAEKFRLRLLSVFYDEQQRLHRRPRPLTSQENGNIENEPGVDSGVKDENKPTTN